MTLHFICEIEDMDTNSNALEMFSYLSPAWVASRRSRMSSISDWHVGVF